MQKGYDVDWVNLTERIVAASRISFSDLIDQRRSEGFYAFALYTDGDCYTVLPSANSLEKHNEKLSKRGIDDPRNMAGYKWSIGEWAYEAWKDKGFEDICRDLSAASQSACEAGTFPEFRQQVHSSMVKALAFLDGEGCFGSIRNEIVIFISSTDVDEAIDMENQSAKVLNSPVIHDGFLKRYTVGER